ncbi:hypothetical protein NBRC116494_25320 [Aurantivibrio plasticivorans]
MITQKNGVEIFTDNVLDADLSKVSDCFEAGYEKYKNLDYPNVASLSLDQVKLEDEFFKIYNTIQEKFELKNSELELEKLWLVKSTSETSDPDKLPYIPHIDYNRFFKVMVYVDEVSQKDGPFHAAPSRPDDFETFRLKLPKNYKDYQGNKVESIAIEKYKAFFGPAGSVLLFDTNCPHFAGNLIDGGERRVLRFDFQKSDWTRKKGISGFISKVFS